MTSNLTVPRVLAQEPGNLRVIKTARTVKGINNGAKAGYRPLVKEVVPGEKIHSMFGVFQHQITGEIIVMGDCRWPPEGNYKQAIDYTTYYPYHFPNPFAAYLIPPDLKVGEHVWLEDLIEDVVKEWGNQGHNPRLEAGEAIWDGTDFTILFDSERDAPRLIG